MTTKLAVKLTHSQVRSSALKNAGVSGAAFGKGKPTIYMGSKKKKTERSDKFVRAVFY